MSAYEVKVFRQLRDKYDLSIEQNEISSDTKSETELTNNAQVTLIELKKVKNSFFKILIIFLFIPFKSFSNYVLLNSNFFSNMLLELVETKYEKQKGLMDVDKNTDSNGMLFYINNLKLLKCGCIIQKYL